LPFDFLILCPGCSRASRRFKFSFCLTFPNFLPRKFYCVILFQLSFLTPLVPSCSPGIFPPTFFIFGFLTPFSPLLPPGPRRSPRGLFVSPCLSVAAPTSAFSLRRPQRLSLPPFLGTPSVSITLAFCLIPFPLWGWRTRAFFKSHLLWAGPLPDCTNSRSSCPSA